MQNKTERFELHDLISQLGKLLPCTNGVKKEIRRDQTKKIQDILKQNNFADLSQERLDEINNPLGLIDFIIKLYSIP